MNSDRPRSSWWARAFVEARAADAWARAAERTLSIVLAAAAVRWQRHHEARAEAAILFAEDDEPTTMETTT